MCDIGYLIRDHIPALMQVVTHDIRDQYNLSLQTTRCVNTAIMIMYLLLGAGALGVTAQCDRNNIHGQPGLNSETAIMLKNLALDHNAGQRVLYYVVVSSGTMADQHVKRGDKVFPGHVFVIERVPRGAQERIRSAADTFNLYQSYIGKYDLSNQAESNLSFSIGARRMAALLDGLVHLGSSLVWDKQCTAFWMALTRVDGQEFEGYSLSNVHLCFRSVETHACVSNLRAYVESKLLVLRTLQGTAYDAVPFPDAATAGRIYSPSDVRNTRPMTNAAIRAELETLLEKMA